MAMAPPPGAPAPPLGTGAPTGPAPAPGGDPAAPGPAPQPPPPNDLTGTVGHGGTEHELDRATRVLHSELRDNAERLGSALFPGGPVGHQLMPRKALLDLVNNHWNDQSFRLKLLQRMAPPGPDGTPQAEGAVEYIKLFKDAILRRNDPQKQMPMSEEDAADDPSMPGLGPKQLKGMEKFGPPTDVPQMAPQAGMPAVPPPPFPPEMLPPAGAPGALPSSPPPGAPMPPMPPAPPMGPEAIGPGQAPPLGPVAGDVVGGVVSGNNLPPLPQ